MKKMLSILLAVLVVLSCFAVTAFAADEVVIDEAFTNPHGFLEAFQAFFQPFIEMIISFIRSYIPMPLV